jgi:hypothetical protein
MAHGSDVTLIVRARYDGTIPGLAPSVYNCGYRYPIAALRQNTGRQRMMRHLLSLVVLVFTLTACVEKMTPQDLQYNLRTAENFIDTFYSFDSNKLKAALSSAEGSIPSILYYQGWASGANYHLVKRERCRFRASNTIACLITVEDDPTLALGTDFYATDTFEISFTNRKITSVETSKNDQQVYNDAHDWVLDELPELVEKPCQGFFNGGPTPAACARAMTEGYGIFAASHDF